MIQQAASGANLARDDRGGAVSRELETEGTMNEPIETRVVITVPPALTADFEALVELYVTELDGDRDAVRRLVETSVITHGMRVLKENAP